ncbi:MAG: TIGR00282 family metallophosphoesterase [Candidatus Gracilibacteria bacterium]|jgi:metallophosphoesterase (TIGR00282 family)
MKLLFIGEIVAKAGRETVKKILPDLRAKYKPDLIIANCENISHGNGFSPSAIKEMQKEGINFFTSGDHCFGNRLGMMSLDDPKFPVIRPANYPPENVPGRGYQIIEDGMMNKILVVNLMGRVFMKKDFDCPFRTMDRILRETAHERLSAIIVDFHAEATSEKYAMGFYLDGKVSLIVGTHTHVATRDFRILDKGTAFICDIGMIGCLDSVIGVRKEVIINSFLTQLPVKHEPEENGKKIFNSVFVELDEKNMKALNVEQLQFII